MSVQDYKINYKSDFVLTINGDAGWAVPFCIKFWTGMPSQAYFVGFDGVKYVNCRVGDTPTQLLVMFDDHHLPIGKLMMQIAYHTTIEEFPGSVFDEVTNARDVIVTIDGTDYQVMLDFTGEDAPELEFDLPAYANEAERIQNELQRQQNEADRIAAELQREQATAAAVQGAENVNAQLNGTTLTVTNRQGVSTSVNTKGEQGVQGPVGPEGPQGEKGISIVSFLPKSETATTLIYTITYSNGHTQDVAIPKGPKGDTGATGPTGPQGPQGDTGVSITDFVETGETETATLYNITFSNGTTQQVAIPKGEKGDQGPAGPTGPQGPMGDVAVITPEQQAAFTMYSVPGQNSDGAMTQKAVTDALVGSAIAYDNSQSGLSAENVQGALDEVVDFIPKVETTVTYPSATVDGVEFGNGVWAAQNSRKLYFIPYTYKNGDVLKIVTSGYVCIFAFLTSNSHTVGQSIDYCAGTSQKYVATNSAKSFEIPSTCTYICVYAYWGSTSILPDSMRIIGIDLMTRTEIENEINIVDNKYAPLELSTQYVPLVSSSILVTGVGSSATKWVSEPNRKIYFIPYTYKQGDVLVMTAQSAYAGIASLLKNNSHTVGDDVDYATGTGRIYFRAGTTIEQEIPSDCHYIMVYAYYGNTSILPESIIIRNDSVISANHINEEINKTYFSEVYQPTFEPYKSGMFLNQNGTYGYSNDYTVYKLSNFRGNEVFELTFWMAGTVPLATVYDANGNSLGYISPSTTTQKYHTFTLNLNNYTNPAYVLCNTYLYTTHNPVNLTTYESFDERYPSYVQQLKNEIISQVSGMKSISILFIGNSLTQDTVSYLPLILKEIAPEIDFKIYDWYNSGATLAQQYTKFTNNQVCEIFSKCENATSWVNFSNSVTMNDILSTYDFDIVCLQEYSYYDFTEQQLTTNYNNIVSYISANYDKSVKYITLIDQPNRSKVETMYQQSVNYAKTFLKNTVCEDIINAGGALYLALQTSLDSLGDQQHLSPDGTHAQEGLPCVLQAYVHAIWIFERLGIPKSVYNSQTRITAANYPAINVPGPNLGTGVVEGTDAQYNIAQECAIKAYKLSRKYVNEVLETLPETI